MKLLSKICLFSAFAFTSLTLTSLNSFALLTGCPSSAEEQASDLLKSVELQFSLNKLSSLERFEAIVNETEAKNCVNPTTTSAGRAAVCKELVKNQFQAFELSRVKIDLGPDAAMNAIQSFRRLQTYQSECRIEAFRDPKTDELKIRNFIGLHN